jgi:hypothetical protein
MTARRTAPGTAESNASGTWRLHGLTVESCLPLPGLEPGAGAPDVQIVWGPVPDGLADPVTRGGLFQAAAGVFLLRIRGLVAFLVRNGSEIVVQAEPHASVIEIQTFLFGAPIAALLHQRGLLVLHGSAVVGPAGALLLLGESGRGKSTLTAALACRGYSVLTDDVAAVSVEDGTPVVHHGVPQVRLWGESVQRLGLEAGPLARTRPGLEKYVVPFPRRSLHGAVPIAAIATLEIAPAADVTVETLGHGAAFHALRALTRNLQAMEGLGMRHTHFRLGTAVAAAVPVLRLCRPKGIDTIEAMVEHAEGFLR